ncbi:UDP-N-acetylmuramoylalanyl-D-glutamate--2,6-diaminopimelate ligase [Lysobacter daejeonensis GH1-9]|uniref:UDP-N-acetylmuramoyl-L-alanyl-D-glutamate--2,6-diaminopimelate ligase n=1 Tax=Lysobacter daejeonensis GH1-9 TaxID=1385517 RepID=A0A0A0ESC1_9GAMM|nr:UDP-N-acetylmuramoyl-L-alanyl-D-glutamate--2,6-diaminopimelate ligase [Lysobacter daejeonensis]KGM53836.1 UDP-N-acetylmuramoylalanyl-D-glutamate--2,6-diaminopimelate ligase [Lysobacter daejeonensis GH1-9]
MSPGKRLANLLPDVAGIPGDLRISALVMDSREVTPGCAFVAIAGFGAHGLQFAEQALASGAVAVLFEPPAPADQVAPAGAIAVPNLRARLGELADAFHDRVTDAMTLVGVTGTNGKTSTVQLLAQAWTLQGTTAGTVGTLGAGLYGQVVPTGFTTPLVLRTHGLLAELHDAGAQAVAMEVSSHALDQGRVAGLHYDVAVFTNLTRDHLDYHGDMDSYGAAKARLFQWPGLKGAAINLDDAFGATLPGLLAAGVRCVGFSSRGHADAVVRAEALHLDAGGIHFDLVVHGESHPVHSPLLGRFNIDNLLAVAATLYALGQAPADIAATLAKLQPIHGRMNRLGGDAAPMGHRPLVVVDYAHTPDALEQALASLRGHAQARLLCVFGCGGERDRGKRPQMAAIAERLADVVVVTDDNPRAENGDRIVQDIMAGFAAPQAVHVQRDRAKAIAFAVAAAAADDIVLVAGKGHEPYQEISGVKHPFDDTDVARAALEARA